MKRASSLRFRRPKPIGRSVLGLGRFSAIAMSADLLCGRGRMLGGPPDGRDDILVARTAADPARDRHPDLVLARVGVLVDQRTSRPQHPGAAGAAVTGVQL